MLPLKDVREIVSQAVLQNRNIKGTDTCGDFHAVVLKVEGDCSEIRLLSTGEVRRLDFKGVGRIFLNGSGSSLRRD